MALRPPEPGSFEHLLQAVEVEVAHLVRLSRRPATEPWWSRSAAHRFDDPEKAFGVCYLASRLDTAFCESVVHQSALFVGGQYAVASADLRGRHIVTFAAADLARPRLVLADLTGSALKALGLNNDLSATDDYTMPQQWSRAVHEAGARWDGIRYVSRQRNDDYCYAVYERSGLQRAGARLCLRARRSMRCAMSSGWLRSRLVAKGRCALPDKQADHPLGASSPVLACTCTE